MTQIYQFPPYKWVRDPSKGDPSAAPWLVRKILGYGWPWITLWHVDPCTDGSDDSCGWFARAKHGDQEMLERIIKRVEFDWDRVYVSNPKDCDDCDCPRGVHVFGCHTLKPPVTYFCGYFKPTGEPHFPVQAIVLNLFFDAAHEMFGREKAFKYINSHMAEIMMFAINPTDSLHDNITMKFGPPRDREERIRGLVSSVYSYILRDTRPWWKHPKWHVHHWKIQVRVWGRFCRWMWSKCCKCGKGFKFGESPTTNSWDSQGPSFFRGETDVYHSDCGYRTNGCQQATEAVEEAKK